MEHRSLYYMAPLGNAVLISMLGIVARNRLERNGVLCELIDAGSIANPEVSAIRHRRMLVGRSLHDFVPLYWAVKTPMQYVVTVRPGHIDPDDLVIFELDADAVLSLPGVWMTDGNAAASCTRFFRGTEGLAHVDWRVVANDVCYSREWKRKKSAEVLVPDAIPLTCVRRACLRSCDAAQAFRAARGRVAAATRGAGVGVPRFPEAVARPQLYF